MATALFFLAMFPLHGSRLSVCFAHFLYMVNICRSELGCTRVVFFLLCLSLLLCASVLSVCVCVCVFHGWEEADLADRLLPCSCL